MSVYDPKKIRPRDGWLVVLAEPRKQKVGSILLPGEELGVEKVCEGAGRIIRAGKGEKNSTVGVEDGQRIVFRGFLKHANPIETDERWEDGQPKQYFVMSVEDVLAIIPDDMDVGALSGRPQVPEWK